MRISFRGGILTSSCSLELMFLLFFVNMHALVVSNSQAVVKLKFEDQSSPKFIY